MLLLRQAETINMTKIPLCGVCSTIVMCCSQVLHSALVITLIITTLNFDYPFYIFQLV